MINYRWQACEPDEIGAVYVSNGPPDEHGLYVKLQVIERFKPFVAASGDIAFYLDNAATWQDIPIALQDPITQYYNDKRREY